MEDNRIFLISSENLTILRSLYFNNNSILSIKQNSKITALNFDYPDTIFFGFSDGSIIKYKFNEDSMNLKFDNQAKNICTSSEDDFDNIKCIFSTDRLIQNFEAQNNSGENEINNNNNSENLGLNYYYNEVVIPDENNEEKSFHTKSSGEINNNNAESSQYSDIEQSFSTNQINNDSTHENNYLTCIQTFTFIFKLEKFLI